MGRTVLIVDDHSGFRARARQMLEFEGFSVIGEAEDGATGIAAARDLRPELVLLDVMLPDIDGFQVAEALAGDPQPSAVVLTSSRDASAYRGKLARTPARGFIAKAELSGSALAALLPNPG
jgi:two-component system nitrate/nitrite response regulator NarL